MRVHACMGAVLVVLLTAVLGNLSADPGEATEPQRIARLIRQLGDDAFAKREEASRELDAIGQPALAALRQAAASSDDLEIRCRAERIAKNIAARLLAPLARKEIEALQGTWYSTSTETAGVRQTGEDRTDRHTFTAEQWVCNHGGTVVQSGTIRVIGVNDRLVKINFTITGGTKSGDTWLAIYERNGDGLKWCGGYIGDGRERPATFTTRPGDGYFLRSLKREKK